MHKLRKTIDSYDATFILLCITCAAVILSSFIYLQFYEGADEGYYLRYAALLNRDGLAAFPRMFESYILDNNNWVFPNPLRIAFTAISAAWTRIFGMTFLALSSLSLFCYLLTLAVSYYFSKKYFGQKIALLFSLLLAFSPLNMAMARRALLDSTANLFLVLSIWMFFDILNDGKKFKHSIFVIIYTLAILTKETAILLAPLFILYFLARKYFLKKEYHLRDLLCTCVYPCLLTAAIYLLAAGTPGRALSIIRIILTSPSTNRYALLYCLGPWFRYIVDFILLSPWVALLGISFFFSFLSARENRQELLYFAIIFAGYFLLINLFAKNVRYAILLDLPIRLFSVFMILEIIERIFRKATYINISSYILVITLAVYDYMSFYRLFVTYSIYDPVSFLLLKARLFIP